ncbi:hypothetical protein [Robiginitomaculum antarcticum]|uniref:hypothetical protein n=1 Tax=Robiginitomaculum antarcticum TaxID=437507 RepID=UPI00037A7014|nr:hypothetical protein [Robiginitomaculum antarcticum]
MISSSPPSNMARLSTGLVLIAALILTAIPVGALATRSVKLNAGRTITLPVQITRAQDKSIVPLVDIATPLQTLLPAQLSGDNYFSVGDTVYVFLKDAGTVWYPYAVLRKLPYHGENLRDDQIMLAGYIVSMDDGEIKVEYGFDQIAPRRDFVRDALRRSGQQTQLELSVSDQGVGRVSGLWLDGKHYSQRPSLNLTLDGFNIITESSAPPA